MDLVNQEKNENKMLSKTHFLSILKSCLVQLCACERKQIVEHFQKNLKGIFSIFRCVKQMRKILSGREQYSYWMTSKSRESMEHVSFSMNLLLCEN